MTSTKPRVLIRTDDATKAALDKAAADDHRSVSNLIEVVMDEWLRERGYLPEPKPKRTKK